ncbi:diacylglycerol kinase 4 [Ricinus communis]|uniref:Diacylglycerol kinase n=1 Tax=Ricinus communis TaxID=3988 RepID=B9T0H8_RICCO|nr:diacylglycerol kinase 4 [Ricinus communis]EEF30636.1 diacylglycerol kinase, alpha, putative [Ricinus communis]|eukprot:XP_002531747.1 diacylglycerol kinase 4 [Ricinus communis]
MDSPTSGSTARIIPARSSMIESIRGCGLSGVRIDREELKRKLLIPEYLRHAIRDSIKSKDPAGEADRYFNKTGELYAPREQDAPEGPLVVFVNSKSGGRHGPELKLRLQQLMGEEQVFDLSVVKPHEFVDYGLVCLEKMAALGDPCARETREKIRIVVAGGDGTVGWVLGSLAALNQQGREPIPPVGIIPLGTGNDLARSFGWGGSFPFAWKSAVKRSLQRAITGQVCHLDSWHLLVSMPCGEVVDPPHSLKTTEECSLDQGLEVEGQLPEKVNCYDGVFYNYFSIGMDAQVAYGFHHLRNDKPYLAQGPISNKLIYSGYSCTQGWFLTPCISDPRLRGLKNILRMHVKKVNCSEWEQIPVPKSVRAIVALNLHNYGSGRNPWGTPKPEYLEKKGFVQAHADDGLLEIFGLKQGWHASFVMVELISAKHIAQAAAIRLEIRGGEWKDAYMQMDGEPWKQPMSKEYSSFVEIKRVPHRSFMINGE